MTDRDSKPSNLRCAVDGCELLAASHNGQPVCHAHRDVKPVSSESPCGCCGHPRKDHGPGGGRCWGPRGAPLSCKCGAFTPPLTDRDTKTDNTLEPDLVVMLAQAATDPALRAEAVIALWRSWGDEPTAENQYEAANDPATGERIYVKRSTRLELTQQEKRLLEDERLGSAEGRTHYETGFLAIIERLLAAAEPEVVICSAMRLPDDRVIRGHRHPDCIRTAHALVTWNCGVDPGEHHWQPWFDVDQGFVTSRNRYVDRKEGLRLQRAAGIESAAPGGYRGELFSEDLY